MPTRMMKGRRDLIAGLGAVATAGAMGARPLIAQESSGDPFQPTLHSQDDWMSELKGQHRIVIDTTSAEGVPDAIRFAGNLLSFHRSGWGVDESDVAVLVCFRHGATAYGYTDAVWSKYGATMAPSVSPTPIANPYNSGGRAQIDGLARRGVQFMLCGAATRGLAGRIAGGGAELNAVYEEMIANTVSNARVVPAGVVAVVHAQERRFSLISVG